MDEFIDLIFIRRQNFWYIKSRQTTTHVIQFLTTHCVMIRNAWKVSVCQMRTTKAQISLRLCAGWSGPLLSSYWINGYYRMYLWTEKALIRLRDCPDWSGHSSFAFYIRAYFVFYAYNIVFENREDHSCVDSLAGVGLPYSAGPEGLCSIDLAFSGCL